jgi:hypothetical protein
MLFLPGDSVWMGKLGSEGLSVTLNDLLKIWNGGRACASSLFQKYGSSDDHKLSYWVVLMTYSKASEESDTDASPWASADDQEKKKSSLLKQATKSVIMQVLVNYFLSDTWTSWKWEALKTI